MFPLQLQICFISPYNQIIKRNNQIIKTNNQLFKTTVMWIRPRLADVGNNQKLLSRSYNVLVMVRKFGIRFYRIVADTSAVRFNFRNLCFNAR